MANRLSSCVVLGRLLAFGALGCGSSGSDDDGAPYQYGADEVRSSIEGKWEGTMTIEGKAPAPMVLTLSYSAPEVHALCGTRTLSNGGLEGRLQPRCIDMSTMNLTGVLSGPLPLMDDDADELPVRGSLNVMSLRFDGRGDLWIDANSRDLRGTLAGGTLQGTATAHGAPLGTFSLTRPGQ